MSRSTNEPTSPRPGLRRTARRSASRIPLAVVLAVVMSAPFAPAGYADEGDPESPSEVTSSEDDGENEGEEDGEEDRLSEGADAVAGVTGLIVTVLPPATAEQIAVDYGLIVEDVLPTSTDTWLLRAPTGTDIVALAARVSADPRTALAEPDYRTNSPEGAGAIYGWGGGPQAAGTDPAAWLRQPELDRIGVPEATGTEQGNGVTVAVLDTGAQLDHPALVGSLVPGVDIIDGDTHPEDEANGLDDDGDGRVDEGYGHGTHVAGLVLAVAPEARIMPVRVLDTDSRGSSFGVAEGIERAVASGADVVNLSLGTPEQSELFERVLEEVTEDVVVVAAAGNTGSSERVYPGATEGVLSVASVDAEDVRSTFSTFGWVDVAAPGEALVSTWVGGGYVRWGGTSMAAPIVAGQSALLLGGSGEASTEHIVRTVRQTAVPLDASLGEGRVDVAASLVALSDGRGD